MPGLCSSHRYPSSVLSSTRRFNLRAPHPWPATITSVGFASAESDCPLCPGREFCFPPKSTNSAATACANTASFDAIGDLLDARAELAREDAAADQQADEERKQYGHHQERAALHYAPGIPAGRSARPHASVLPPTVRMNDLLQRRLDHLEFEDPRMTSAAA